MALYHNNFVLKSEPTQNWFKEHFKHCPYSSFYKWLFEVLIAASQLHTFNNSIRYVSDIKDVGVRFYDTVFVGYYCKEGKLPEKVTVPVISHYGGFNFYLNRLHDTVFVRGEKIAWCDNSFMDESAMLAFLEYEVPQLEIIGWMFIPNIGIPTTKI